MFVNLVYSTSSSLKKIPASWIAIRMRSFEDWGFWVSSICSSSTYGTFVCWDEDGSTTNEFSVPPGLSVTLNCSSNTYGTFVCDEDGSTTNDSFTRGEKKVCCWWFGWTGMLFGSRCSVPESMHRNKCADTSCWTSDITWHALRLGICFSWSARLFANRVYMSSSVSRGFAISTTASIAAWYFDVTSVDLFLFVFDFFCGVPATTFCGVLASRFCGVLESRFCGVLAARFCGVLAIIWGVLAVTLSSYAVSSKLFGVWSSANSSTDRLNWLNRLSSSFSSNGTFCKM